MDDIQLVLVDLDNVRRRDRGPLEHLALPERIAEVDGPPCVVVFAMNLDTADHHVSAATLRTLAERIATSVGDAPLRGFEVALTLVVKESADAALERLLGSAPIPAHEGRLVTVHLLTEDQGLQESIGDKLRAYEDEKAGGRSTWHRKGKKTPAPRRFVPGELDGFKDEPAEHPHLALTSNERVAAHAGRPVDIALGTPLHEIAGLAARRPGLLTQLGITTESVRGIGRMHAVVSGQHPRLGPLDPGDGVELCGDSVPPGRYANPSPSPLGAGAVRFESPPGTLATTLPTAVVLAAGGSFRGDFGVIDDWGVFDGLDESTLSRTDVVKVRFAADRDSLVAEARRDFGRSLGGWWWTCTGPNSTPTTDAKPRLEQSGISCKGRFTVPARCALGVGRELILRAPYTGSTTARVSRTTEALVPGSVNGTPVACLLPVGTPPGEVRVTPIQATKDKYLLRLFPEYRQHFHHLRKLPLMVRAR